MNSQAEKAGSAPGQSVKRAPALSRYRGEARVVIDKVTPTVDGGIFPAKRLIGEAVEVHADVFTDGHDAIAVVLQYRKLGESGWNELPMLDATNDRWKATFTPDQIGIWEYAVTGWVDHFQSWLHGLRKKVEGGQDVSVELLIGAELLEQASARASRNDAKTLSDWAATLRGHNQIPVAGLVELALSEPLGSLARRYPDRTHATTTERVYSVMVEREKAGYSTWYEFFPRSWGEEPGRHGTFRSSEAILPEIARMGFDVVYLPPIHPIGHSHRKGKNNTLKANPDDVGSPWAIGSKNGGHKAIEPQLGTLADFRHFIAAADRSGLEVAIDIAFQCSPDHPYVKEHPDWFKWRPDGTVQYAENPPKKYQDVLPFNFECDNWQQLWTELKSVFEFWIGQGVKIFRVDNPHTKPIDFWQWLIADLKAHHPEVILLAEAFTRPKVKYRLGKIGFSHGYTYFTWRNSRDELRDYLTELTRTEVADYFRPNFWPNTPDILPEVLQYGGRPAFIMRYVLAATLSSNCGMYGPAFELCVGEANPGKEEYFYSEKYEVKHWDWEAPGNIKEIITMVNRIRRQNPALQRTNNITFADTDNGALLAYIKTSPSGTNSILTVVNMDPYHTHSGWVTIPWETLGFQDDRMYMVQDLLAGGRFLWQGNSNYVKLEPHTCPAHIFRVYREQRREQDFDYFM